MTVSRRLTQDEINQRQEILDAEYQKRKNDPEHVAIKNWIKEVFESDLDAICDFAATLMSDSQSTDKENKELIEKLNRIYRNSHYLVSHATTLPPRTKMVIAQMVLKHDADDPVSLAFVSGIGVSKHLQATKGAGKRHVENRAMKAEVFRWLDENMATFRSMDAAAEAIAAKVAPIAVRTARSWVGDWKKLRSAGTT